jgi:hypothetical protein
LSAPRERSPWVSAERQAALFETFLQQGQRFRTHAVELFQVGDRNIRELLQSGIPCRGKRPDGGCRDALRKVGVRR